MEQYISKSALVTKIERLKNTSLEYGYNTMQKVLADSGKDISLRQLQNFIDDLEVNSVDLNEEVKKYLFNCIDNDGLKPINIAKHFFELGMQVSNKAQKGEEV